MIEILDRGNTYHPTEFVSLSFVVLLFYYSLTARIACYWYADLAPFILVMGGIFPLWAPYTCVCNIYSRPTAMQPVQCDWLRAGFLLSGDLRPKFKSISKVSITLFYSPKADPTADQPA